MRNKKTVILGLFFLAIGVMLAIGKAEKIVNMFRKNKQKLQSKKKTRELCLRAGELAILDGLILFMRGLFEGSENHMFLLSVIAWALVACFDVLYVTVINERKNDGG